MANLNRIILVGRLATDPELRTTMESTQIAKFQLSVDRQSSVSAQGETDLFDIVAWRNLAEYAGSSFRKGCMVVIEGRIQNRTYDTKEGQKRYVTEIIASNAVLLEKGQSAAQGKPVPAKAAPATEETVEDSFLDDDLPF